MFLLSTFKKPGEKTLRIVRRSVEFNHP